MESIWSKTTELPAFPSLADDLHTDVAVIGGGMAGLLIAQELKKNGYQVTVLEANKIGSGQTQSTTAKITSSHRLIYQELIANRGIELAKQYADANQKAVNQYEKIIRDYEIECKYQKKTSYLYSQTDAHIIEKEVDSARKLGINAAFTMNHTLPFPIKGAVAFEEQAQFHPLQFIKGMIDPLTIYENTNVKSVEENKIITDSGTVTAESVVFATHYPFINMPGYFFMRMHQERSYVMALRNAQEMEGMYLGVDRDNSLSFRNYNEYLLIGGGAHRTGENAAGEQIRMLKEQSTIWWPQSEIAETWSAQDCMTLDDVPYIGRYSSSKPNWYVATGFGKWGMTSSMVAAIIISDLIMEKENPYAQVFSPQRSLKTMGLKKIAVEGFTSTKGLIRQNFKSPKQTVEELPAGHGGIVSYNGKKLGAYKNQEGEVFLVTTKCPHLGCQLEWNPADLSWECPCHGSRFDYHGNLLDNPSMEGIAYKEQTKNSDF